jgi:hypothetical protein
VTIICRDVSKTACITAAAAALTTTQKTDDLKDISGAQYQQFMGKGSYRF